jgi:hypothetical protein
MRTGGVTANFRGWRSGLRTAAHAGSETVVDSWSEVHAREVSEQGADPGFVRSA